MNLLMRVARQPLILLGASPYKAKPTDVNEEFAPLNRGRIEEFVNRAYDVGNRLANVCIGVKGDSVLSEGKYKKFRVELYLGKECLEVYKLEFPRNGRSGILHASTIEDFNARRMVLSNANTVVEWIEKLGKKDLQVYVNGRSYDHLRRDINNIQKMADEFDDVCRR